MKKSTYIFLSVYILMMCNALHSENAGRIIDYGFTAGANISGLTGTDRDIKPGIGEIYSVINRKIKFGIAGGFFVSYQIKGNFYLQPELIFSMEGGKFLCEGNINDTDIEADIDYRLNYLEFPFLAVYKIDLGNYFGINIIAGPAFCVVFSADIKSNTTYYTEPAGTESKIQELLGATNPNFSINGGIGFEWESIAGKFHLDAGYGYGLMNISTKQIRSDTEAKMKNSVFRILLGFSF